MPHVNAYPRFRSRDSGAFRGDSGSGGGESVRFCWLSMHVARTAAVAECQSVPWDKCGSTCELTRCVRSCLEMTLEPGACCVHVFCVGVSWARPRPQATGLLRFGGGGRWAVVVWGSALRRRVSCGSVWGGVSDNFIASWGIVACCVLTLSFSEARGPSCAASSRPGGPA